MKVPKEVEQLQKMAFQGGELRKSIPGHFALKT